MSVKVNGKMSRKTYAEVNGNRMTAIAGSRVGMKFRCAAALASSSVSFCLAQHSATAAFCASETPPSAATTASHLEFSPQLTSLSPNRRSQLVPPFVVLSEMLGQGGGSVQSSAGSQIQPNSVQTRDGSERASGESVSGRSLSGAPPGSICYRSPGMSLSSMGGSETGSRKQPNSFQTQGGSLSGGSVPSSPPGSICFRSPSKPVNLDKLVASGQVLATLKGARLEGASPKLESGIQSILRAAARTMNQHSTDTICEVLEGIVSGRIACDCEGLLTSTTVGPSSSELVFRSLLGLPATSDPGKAASDLESLLVVALAARTSHLSAGGLDESEDPIKGHASAFLLANKEALIPKALPAGEDGRPFDPLRHFAHKYFDARTSRFFSVNYLGLVLKCPEYLTFAEYDLVRKRRTALALANWKKIRINVGDKSVIAGRMFPELFPGRNDELYRACGVAPLRAGAFVFADEGPFAVAGDKLKHAFEEGRVEAVNLEKSFKEGRIGAKAEQPGDRLSPLEAYYDTILADAVNLMPRLEVDFLVPHKRFLNHPQRPDDFTTEEKQRFFQTLVFEICAGGRRDPRICFNCKDESGPDEEPACGAVGCYYVFCGRCAEKRTPNCETCTRRSNKHDSLDRARNYQETFCREHAKSLVFRPKEDDPTKLDDTQRRAKAREYRVGVLNQQRQTERSLAARRTEAGFKLPSCHCMERAKF